MPNDPWAAASASVPSTATSQQNGGQESSNLAESFAGQGSQLFAGGPLKPSIFNKTHLLGTVRTGIITKAPYDVHARDYNTKKPKYWQEGADKPVTNAINSETGEKNTPVKDTIFELDTDYRMDAAERAATGRDGSFEDDGSRVFVAGGYDLKETRRALQEAAKELGLRCEEDLVGKRITIKRAAQKPNPSGNPSWIIAVKFSAA